MLEIDLHVHSIFSHCGLHTVLELINQARATGMKGLAITDHGLTMGGRLNDVFLIGSIALMMILNYLRELNVIFWMRKAQSIYLQPLFHFWMWYCWESIITLQKDIPGSIIRRY